MPAFRFLSLALGLLVAGCGVGVKAGDPCTGSDATCDSAVTSLACISGRYKSIACPGVNGCRSTSTKVTCDEANAKSLGDACFVYSTNIAFCDKTKTQSLYCNALNVMALNTDCSTNNQVCKDDGTSVTCVDK